jgi:hypothetical protein
MALAEDNVPVWDGSWCELAIELGDAADDRLVEAALALWSHPDLDGPYLDGRVEKRLDPLGRTCSVGRRCTGSRLCLTETGSLASALLCVRQEAIG